MIEILYRDRHIVVCLKPVGVVSQQADGECLPNMLCSQLQIPQVWPVHRLDKLVGGVMVYALTPKAAAELSRMVQERTLKKYYLAVLCGVPTQRQSILEDLLFHDRQKNKTYIVDRVRKGVKDASLHYSVLQSVEDKTLVSVELHTGRTHQIRVQFAGRKLPLYGDRRYGSKNTDAALALWSCRLRFPHPVTGEEMAFYQSPPATQPWQLFEEKHLQSETDW